MKNIILLFLTLIVLLTPAMAQTIIPLYSDKIPNSKPGPNQEVTEVKDGITRISKISIPTLTVFLPAAESANGTSVIIFPGGGYSINASSHEGTDVAKKFNTMGITAFVVKYRIPNDATMENKEIGPLQDAQQAIKVVRERAKEWKINPKRVGIMGFSAGGHLASTAGTHFDTILVPNEKKTSVRPDFMILVYPVISFHPAITHMGSRNQLLGTEPTPEKIKLYSNELQVTDQTPPSFLVHASDDGAVRSENSIVFYQALIRNKVPVEMHLYQNGGHGFGMVNKTTSELWMDRCYNWMKSCGWL